MAQREIIHRLSKCFQALPRRDWLDNLVWHAKKGNPVLCGSMDHDWYIKYGFGSPAVMAVTRADLTEFQPTMKINELPAHIRHQVMAAFEALCVPYGYDVYMDTLEAASQEDIYEAILSLDELNLEEDSVPEGT